MTAKNDTSAPVSSKDQNAIEKGFEFLLWHSKSMTLIAVVFGVFGSLVMFLLGSLEVFHAITAAVPVFSGASEYEGVVAKLIGAVDMYLIGIVILLFSFGVYELFISPIDIARKDKDISILEIHSLDELKNKLLKVITMVMVVSFFKTILALHFTSALEILYFSLAILAVSVAVYLIRKKEV